MLSASYRMIHVPDTNTVDEMTGISAAVSSLTDAFVILITGAAPSVAVLSLTYSYTYEFIPTPTSAPLMT